MDNLLSFIGHFHPLLVHFPIGILVLAILLACWNRLGTPSEARKALTRLALAIGALGSMIAAVTGWFLANQGSYDDATLFQHRWTGIGTALLAIMAWRGYGHRFYPIAMGSMALLLVASLHLGSTLTHGVGYWLNSPVSVSPVAMSSDSLLKTNEKLVFSKHIQPILNQKCVSCHKSGKTKGKLNMENAESFEKGGKSGKIIVAKNSESSEIYRRISLDLHSEEHMPPKSKPQLDAKEVAIIARWIEQGGVFDNK